MATPAKTPARPAIRPYRDFLTPSLHRRFTNAALLSFATSYVVAIAMAPSSLLWFWFPISATGLRAVLIFISMLLVYVVRVAFLHVGTRQYPSPFSRFLGSITKWRPYYTALWYALSAWLFAEVYIYSAPAKAQLNIVDAGKPYERPHLNERPIWFRSLFIMLGVYQTVYHVWWDFDQVSISSTRGSGSQNDIVAFIKAQSGRVIQHALRTMIISTPIFTFVYTLLLRRYIWRWTYIATSVTFSLPKFQKMSAFPPFFGDLFVAYWLWGYTLVMLWSIANTAFDTYIAHPPLNKKGEPLSADSKDPNGTLLAGLKGKREYLRTSAFAELLLIAQEDIPRRQTLFKELDRAGGSTWTQIVTICLGQLHGITTRINDVRNPPSPTPPMPEQVPGDVNHLPRMAPPIKEGNILTSSPPPASRFAADVGSFARSHGSYPEPQNPVSPRARKLLTASAHRFLSEDQQRALSQSGLSNSIQNYALDFVRLPYIGPLFRTTFDRQASIVVVGDPNTGGTSKTVILNAVSALSILASYITAEDSYGKASRDIANIIRTHVGTITAMEDFVAWLQPHWTDVEFKDKKVTDIDEIVKALKEGLRNTLDIFENYSELGLSLKEKRIAKEKAGMNNTDDIFIETVSDSTVRADMRERRRRTGHGSTVV